LPELAVGATLRVLADDPAAAGDIAAWCRMRDHEFAGSPAPATFDVRRRH
jgi:tRNA 2-thiouridine synthesizing protein A